MSVHSPEPPKEAPKVPTPIPSFFPDNPLPVQHLGFHRPFIRLGNICLHVDRIVSAEFLPKAALYKVGDHVLYQEASAEHEAELLDRSSEKFNAPILYLRFINANDMTEEIRRWGEEAEDAWEYITSNLASP
ncbi:hypothetical protein KA005_45650 [bacterium]|nr:hypothetical protein [bacterium]